MEKRDTKNKSEYDAVTEATVEIEDEPAKTYASILKLYQYLDKFHILLLVVGTIACL